MEDGAAIMRVLSLAEKQASRQSASHAMCMSFVRICISFENCDRLDVMQQTTSLLLKNIISASHRLRDNAGIWEVS